MTAVAKSFLDATGRRWTFQKPGEVPVSMSNTAQVSVAPAWANDVMTFTMTSATYAQAQYKLAGGWTIYHLNTGTRIAHTETAT